MPSESIAAANKEVQKLLDSAVKLAGDPGFTKLKSTNSHLQVIRKIYYPRTCPTVFEVVLSVNSNECCMRYIA